MRLRLSFRSPIDRDGSSGKPGLPSHLSADASHSVHLPWLSGFWSPARNSHRPVILTCARAFRMFQTGVEPHQQNLFHPLLRRPKGDFGVVFPVFEIDGGNVITRASVPALQALKPVPLSVLTMNEPTRRIGTGLRARGGRSVPFFCYPNG